MWLNSPRIKDDLHICYYLDLWFQGYVIVSDEIFNKHLDEIPENIRDRCIAESQSQAIQEKVVRAPREDEAIVQLIGNGKDQVKKIRRDL